MSLESATSGEGRLHWPTKKNPLNSSSQKVAGSSNPKLRHPSLAAVGTKSCWLLKLALYTFLCGCLDLSDPVLPLVCNINISTCIGQYSRWKNLHIPPLYCVCFRSSMLAEETLQTSLYPYPNGEACKVLATRLTLKRQAET